MSLGCQNTEDQASVLASANAAAGAAAAAAAAAAANSQAGPAPNADLSHALWMHAALRNNKHRVQEGETASLFIVPAFGSLSEATGACPHASNPPTCSGLPLRPTHAA